MTTKRKAAVASTVGRMVRILATDARQIARILDNDLASGLYDDATEWEYSQLLARLRAAIENPNTERHAPSGVR